MATKIAEVLQVSLDYLVGKTDLELDNNTLKRIQAISKLPEKQKRTRVRVPRCFYRPHETARRSIKAKAT